MINYSVKNTIILGLIDPDTLEEYGTVTSASGKGKPVPPPAPDRIYPDPSSGNWFGIDAGAGDDLIDARLTARATELYGGLGNDTIYGGTYGSEYPQPYFGPGSYVDGDYIDGGAGRDIIDAGLGNDVVVYDANDTRVEGDGGYDTLDASGAAAVRGKGVTIDLSSTRDAFSGFEGIYGSAYADTLTGNEASNYFDGGAGADTIRLGYGFDVVAYDSKDLLVDGGFDRDLITGERWYSESSTGMDINLETSTIWINFEAIDGSQYNDTLTGNAQSNDIEGNWGADLIHGGAGADYLSGGEDIDTIYGDDGSDSILGGNGADRLYGGAGNDEIHGGDGNDFISGGANDDEIYGDGGTNTMMGEDGADIIHGGGSTDNIYGGLGDDHLFGDKGNDHLAGGAGADDVDSGDGNDTVEYDPADTYTDNSGIDTLDASSSNTAVSIDLTEPAYGDFENITGSYYDDTLVGKDGVQNVLRGGGGGDQINGGEDVDTYAYWAVNESYIINDENPATGFDSVFGRMNDVFDFAEGVADVVVNSISTGQAMAATGAGVLSQLDTAFKDYLGDGAVIAALITFDDPHTFLVVDSDADGYIDEFDQVIELVGGGSYALSLQEGNVTLIGLPPPPPI